MTGISAVGLVVFFSGATLVLAEHPWFRHRPLMRRLAPYVPGTAPEPSQLDQIMKLAWRDGLVPLLRLGADRLSRALGVTEPLVRRLERAHSPRSVSEFRLVQFGWSGAGLTAGALVASAAGLPGPLAAGFVIGGAFIGFLSVEQRLISQIRRRQGRLLRELPVVAEQLGLLLGAGYSLGMALQRIGERGSGVCAQDLVRVVGRIRVGLSDAEALREWADLADVPALSRLVGVLTVGPAQGDMAAMVSQQARAVRREVHRELLASLERRAQAVWVPVALATLVPGALFLAVPFVETLRMFSEA